MTLTPADGFSYYIGLTKDSDVKSLFSSTENFKILSKLSEEQSRYRYAPGKWSIRQIVGHITDHERIMIYRALRFSRMDPTELPGYDQDLYMDNGYSDELNYESLLQDFRNVRASSISFMNTLSPQQLELKGVASKQEISVGDIMRATIGHELHHMEILAQRYLKNL